MEWGQDTVFPSLPWSGFTSPITFALGSYSDAPASAGPCAGWWKEGDSEGTGQMGELIPIQVKPVLVHSTPTTSRAAEGQEHQKGTGRSCVHLRGHPACITHTCTHHGPRVTQSASYNAGHTAGGRPREGSEAAVLTRSCVSAAHTREARLPSSHCALERITPTTGEANCADFTMGGGTTQ